MFSSRSAFAFGLCCSFAAGAAELQVQLLQSNNVSVLWPTNDPNFTLQMSDRLPPPSNGWPAFPRARGTNGTNFRVLDGSAVSGRFFRLYNGGPPQPPQLGVSGPASVTITNQASVTLNYSDPNGDLALLWVTLNGTNRSIIPTVLLNMGGTNGQVQFPLEVGRLPFGASTLEFQVADLHSLTSSVASLALTVSGVAAGGTAPTFAFVTNGQPNSISRPNDAYGRFRPRLSYTYSDPDGDLFRIRARLIKPGGVTNLIEETAAALSMTGTSGTGTLAFLTFSNTSPLGSYTVQLSGEDRNGNVSAVASRSLILTNFGLGESPALWFSPGSPFSPTNGGPGTVVTLLAFGFDPVATNNRVFLNDVELPVLDVSGLTLTVKLIDGVETGPFIARIPGGASAISFKSFQVPASVRVEPANLPTDDSGNPVSPVELAAGASLQFRARVVPTAFDADRSVDWFVNGAAGGNATAGTINSAGLYQAPGTVPTGGLVTVSAKLHNSPSVSDATNVLILPATVLPGVPVVVAAAKGGTVFARDLRASVRIPPGALAADTAITVNEPSAAPTPETGRRVLGYAEFLPSGTVFSSPAQITLPLNRVLTPGTVLPLRFYQPTNGSYVNEGILAMVTEEGDRAVASLTHFTIAVVDETNIVSCASPTITSIDPASMREGERRPMRLAGTGLTPILTFEVRNADGTPTTDVTVETFVGLGTNAGVLLKGAALTNFDTGTRDYRLRAVCPAGGTAEIVFQVQGLPQLLVQAGQTSEFNDPPPMTVSGVQVAAGGRIAVNSGELKVESMGDVLVDGIIDAGGAPGGNGNETDPGQPGTLGHGGRGGQGRLDSDGFLGLDGAEPENYGRNANDALGHSEDEQGISRPYGPTDRFPQGIGGLPGENLEFDPTQIYGLISECITSGGIACFNSAAELARLGRQVFEFVDGGGGGKRGYGAVRDSLLDTTGGGGGGGGGMMHFSISPAVVLGLLGIDVDSIPVLGEALSYVSVTIIGGGGGGGGDGGRRISITTPGSIVMGPNGKMTTAGGNGGDGSSAGIWDFDTALIDIPEIHGLPVLTGGAGGGGRGGRLSVKGGLGIIYNSYGQFDSRAGRGGVGGIAYLDPANQVNRFQMAGAADSDGPAGLRFVAGPQFNPESFRSKVTTRLLLPIDILGGLAGGYAIIQVQGESASASFTVSRGNTAFAHDNYVLLFPGHNTVSSPWAVTQNMLVLATDADGDGLSDGDEADFGTDPNMADTDGDGLNDGPDLLGGGNPLRADTDGDGLRDGVEVALGTNLHKTDSDGDGLWDSAEVLLGSGPTNAASFPQQITAGLLFASGTHPGTTPAGAYLIGIERNTGSFGLFGRPASGLGFGLAFDHFGTLYFSDGKFLRTYDPLAQTNATVGEFDPTNHTIQCGVLAFDPLPTDRFLYGAELGGPLLDQTGQLLRINRHTGQAVRIGAPLAQRYRSLAFTRTGVLYASLENPGNADALVRIDPTNGTILQVIGSTGVTNITGLVVPADQTLVGTREFDGQTNLLLTLDTNSGAASASVSVGALLQDLAVAPCPVPCLQPAVTNAGWPKPTKLKAVDFDKDGKDDLVLLGERSAGSFGTAVAFFHSTSNGLVTLRTNYLISSPFTIVGNDLVAGDINGDTWPDVVTQDPFLATASIAIFTNNGAGSYPAPVITPSLVEPRTLSLGDLNGDGALDLVLAGSGSVVVRYGNGAGGFTNGLALPTNPGLFYLDARIGDINGDDLPDVVAMDSAVTCTFTNAGGGVFPTRLEFNYNYESGSFAMADFDGDGLDDVLVRSWASNGGFHRFRSLGNGFFDPPVLHSYPQTGLSRIDDFAVGDLDFDGLPDLVFTDSGLKKLNLWMNDGDGVFRTLPPRTFTTAQPYAVAIGDFNGDGIPDIAAGNTQNGSLLVLLQE